MRHINQVEFYITNVCNLTCDGCNRFNNIKFRGWQKWSDYSNIYAQWSKLISINRIAIMGGEPLLNPSILEWIAGVHRCWPTVGIQILTNGTYIDRVPNLLETCLSNNAWIGVSKHRNDDLFELEQKIERFIGDIEFKKYDPDGKVSEAGGNYYYENKKGFGVTVWDQYNFSQNALVIKPDGRYTLHNSSPELAHDVCSFAKHNCYHFIHGKFYKCGPVGLFEELDNQYNLDLSESDKELIRLYKPLTVENYDQHHEEFFTKLDQPIEQCKFCPEKFEWKEIFPIVKGSI